MDEFLGPDLDKVVANGFDPGAFAGASFFVTGATGLIGSNLVRLLLGMSERLDLGVSVQALVRDEARARRVLGPEVSGKVRFVEGDVCEPFAAQGRADYVVHAASQTASRAFVQTPLQTIRTAVRGTENALDYAERAQARAVAVLSTMEVYGAPQTDGAVDELHPSNLDTMDVRSCYPESKRLCESLAACWHRERGVPAKVVRLTQTFGPGVAYGDARVFAEFARCAVEGRDIVLHTAGATCRSYLYTADAVAALLCVLARGEAGLAYNAANEGTYCSIRQMAELVAARCAGGRIGVRVDCGGAEGLGYASELHMNLDASRLRALGWRPTTGLDEMFRTLVAWMGGRAPKPGTEPAGAACPAASGGFAPGR